MENHFDIIDIYIHIKRIIDIALNQYGIRYKSDYKAPSTYKQMVSHYETYKYYLVYDGGDHGFLGKEYNIKFRALHDHMHRIHELSFKFNDEKILSELTSKLFRALGKFYLELSETELDNIETVINAEIRGQIEYYEKYGRYVSDQRVFIRDYILKRAV